MRVNIYNVGGGVRLKGTFTNLEKAEADPTTVTLRVKAPSGTVAAYLYGTDAALVRDSTGIYHLDLTVNASGEWWYRWEGTGSVTAADERLFSVRASKF